MASGDRMFGQEFWGPEMKEKTEKTGRWGDEAGGVTLPGHQKNVSIDMENALRVFKQSGAFSGRNPSILNNPNALEPFGSSYPDIIGARVVEISSSSMPPQPAIPTMRSGASEHDEFYYPVTPETNLGNELDVKNQQLQMQNVTIHQLSAQVGALQLQIQDMQYQSLDLQSKIVTQKAKLESARKEITSAHKEIQSAHKEIHTKETELHTKEELLRSKDKEINSLKTPQSIAKRVPDATVKPPVFRSDVAEDGSGSESSRFNFKSSSAFGSEKAEDGSGPESSRKKDKGKEQDLASAMGNLTPYQKRPFQMTPNPADDVFANPPESPTPGPRAFRQADFEKKELPELLSSCFIKVESAVRKVPIVDLVPPEGRRPSYAAKQIIVLLQDHIGNNKLAYGMLEHADERYWAIIALLSHTIVDYIFKDHILGHYMTYNANTYLQVWNEELDTSKFGHPKIGDLVYRHVLAERRAHWARLVIQTPGFWKWVQGYTVQVTEKIVGDFAIAIPQNYHAFLAKELWKSTNEAMRIAIRMKTEPTVQEYNFPPIGTAWNSHFHVHRNQELVGQTLEDDKSPWCVRLAAMPIVKTKSFAENEVKEAILHKAEVIVGDRKEHLRAARNRKW